MLVLHGSSVAFLRQFPPDWFEAVFVTPPWPSDMEHSALEAASGQFWKECFRVMRPGGNLVCFQATDDLGVVIRSCGFEVDGSRSPVILGSKGQGKSVPKLPCFLCITQGRDRVIEWLLRLLVVPGDQILGFFCSTLGALARAGGIEGVVQVEEDPGLAAFACGGLGLPFKSMDVVGDLLLSTEPDLVEWVLRDPSRTLHEVALALVDQEVVPDHEVIEAVAREFEVPDSSRVSRILQRASELIPVMGKKLLGRDGPGRITAILQEIPDRVRQAEKELTCDQVEEEVAKELVVGVIRALERRREAACLKS